MDIRASIEYFHLLFCRSLLTAQDKSLIALKGGCNLRFFHGSNRYSEDIDFDVEVISRDTLKKRVDKVLASQAFQTILAARKLKMSAFSTPKQTDTVQRWKLALSIAGIDAPTKIEFSRRWLDQGRVAFGPVSPLVLAPYNLTATFINHYNAASAIEQKIQALAGRAQTQARDLYDLDLLLAKVPHVAIGKAAEDLEKSLERAMSIDKDQFRGQVVEFLEADAQSYFEKTRGFEELQGRVIRQ